MSTNIKVNTEEFPLVIINMIGEASETEIDEFASELDKVLSETTSNFVIISDQSKEVYMSAAVRIKLGKCLNGFSLKYKNRELAVFVVNKSPVGRMMMKGISLLAGSSGNLKVVSSMDEARTRAQEMIEALSIA